MAKPCTPHLIPQAEQFFEIETANSGVEGDSPRPFSWGCKGDILFREREYPPYPRPPHGVGKTPQRFCAAILSREGKDKKRASFALFFFCPLL